MTRRDQHWNEVFASRREDALGWYEEDVTQTLRFLEPADPGPGTRVMLPGAGTSVLVDQLLGRGCDLILNDISDEALKRLAKRIGQGDRLRWLHHDMSRPLPRDLPPVDLWIDRAVLHFLVAEADIHGYFANLHGLTAPGGHVLLAEFSSHGAEKCAGLDVHRYSLDEMTRRMGPGFELVASEEYTYTNPRGEPRPYLYALYQRHRTRPDANG